MRKISFSTSSMDFGMFRSPPAASHTSNSVKSLSSTIGITTLSKTIAGSGGSLSKSVSGAVANLTGRSRHEAEEMEQQIELITNLLKDVQLQSPSTHAGLILAFTTATISPISNPGIRFTWYRVGPTPAFKSVPTGVDNHYVRVDDSRRSWYAPTVDDIGYRIGMKCEDIYREGLSRYLETGLITADPILCTIIETVLANGHYEVTDTGVSIGTEDLVSITEDNSSEAVGRARGTLSINERPTALRVPIESEGLPTGVVVRGLGAKGEKCIFMEIEGRSKVEVDFDGVFISLSLSANSAASAAVASSDPYPSGGFPYSSTATVHPHSSISTTALNKLPINRSLRRGLLIPASECLRVQCTQPASLVITIPLVRASPRMSTSPVGHPREQLTLQTGVAAYQTSAPHQPCGESASSMSSNPFGYGDNPSDRTNNSGPHSSAHTGGTASAVLKAGATSAMAVMGAAGTAAAEAAMAALRSQSPSSFAMSPSSSSHHVPTATPRSDHDAVYSKDYSGPIFETPWDYIRVRGPTPKNSPPSQRRTQFSSAEFLPIGKGEVGATATPVLDGEALSMAVGGRRYKENCIHEKLLEVEDEVEAASFASVLTSLEEFVGALPETATRVKLCISCADRTQRDVLALAIRSLVGMRTDAVMDERRKCLPWIELDGQEDRHAVIADSSCAGAEMSRLLKTLETEVVALRKERNELNLQLMEAVEHRAVRTGGMSTTSPTAPLVNTQHTKQLEQQRQQLDAMTASSSPPHIDGDKHKSFSLPTATIAPTKSSPQAPSSSPSALPTLIIQPSPVRIAVLPAAVATLKAIEQKSLGTDAKRERSASNPFDEPGRESEEGRAMQTTRSLPELNPFDDDDESEASDDVGEQQNEEDEKRKKEVEGETEQGSKLNGKSKIALDGSKHVTTPPSSDSQTKNERKSLPTSSSFVSATNGLVGDSSPLLARVQELESLLSSAVRRESDLLISRTELEGRIIQLSGENDRLQRQVVSLKEEVASSRDSGDQSQNERLRFKQHVEALQMQLLGKTRTIEDQALRIHDLEEKVKDVPSLKASIKSLEEASSASSKKAVDLEQQLNEMREHATSLATSSSLPDKIAAASVDRDVPLQCSQENDHNKDQSCASNAVVNEDSLSVELKEARDARVRAEEALRSAEAQCAELTDKVDALQVEVNHLTRRAESQARDLKRVMREKELSQGKSSMGDMESSHGMVGGANASSAAGISLSSARRSSPSIEQQQMERALKKKTEECEELHRRLEALMTLSLTGPPHLGGSAHSSSASSGSSTTSSGLGTPLTDGLKPNPQRRSSEPTAPVVPTRTLSFSAMRLFGGGK